MQNKKEFSSLVFDLIVPFTKLEGPIKSAIKFSNPNPISHLNQSTKLTLIDYILTSRFN